MTVTATPEPAKLPSKFWQYLVVYPSLVLSIGGSIPTIWNEVKAWKLGVDRSQLQLVQEQESLWRSNLDCVQQQGVYEADGPKGLVVRVTLCPTGDVLLRYYENDWSPIFKWVRRPTLNPKA